MRRATLVRQRAVVLDLRGPNGGRWMDICSQYALDRHLDVVVVAHDLGEALRQIALGNADVLVVARADMLHPLVRVVADSTASTTAGSRRARRLR